MDLPMETELQAFLRIQWQYCPPENFIEESMGDLLELWSDKWRKKPTVIHICVRKTQNVSNARSKNNVKSLQFCDNASSERSKNATQKGKLFFTDTEAKLQLSFSKNCTRHFQSESTPKTKSFTANHALKILPFCRKNVIRKCQKYIYCSLNSCLCLYLKNALASSSTKLSTYAKVMLTIISPYMYYCKFLPFKHVWAFISKSKC